MSDQRALEISPVAEDGRFMDRQENGASPLEARATLRGLAAADGRTALPSEERTSDLEARVEKTIARKAQGFRQERALKAYEVGLHAR